MRVPFKKPDPSQRVGLERIKTHRFHVVHGENGTMDVVYHYTLRYPEGHPMRRYKDRKKELTKACRV